ncbi:hypothetical protein [Lysobacter gummosus]
MGIGSRLGKGGIRRLCASKRRWIHANEKAAQCAAFFKNSG